MVFMFKFSKTFRNHVKSESVETEDECLSTLVKDDIFVEKAISNAEYVSMNENETDYENLLKSDQALVRKLDLHMFPLMCLTCAVQFMDKVAIASSSVMGLRDDLDVHDNLYSWIGSAFYFGYLIMHMGPVQLIFQKNKYMAKTLSLFIVLWGVLSCCQVSSNISYSSFMTLRVLIGCAESVVTPCFTIITSQYWKPEEQFTRISIWFGMNGLGSIVLNSIAYGIFIRKKIYLITAWKILFLIIGSMAMLTGLVFFFWIPDDPSNALFLSEQEKRLVYLRVTGNDKATETPMFKTNQINEALRDPRTWLYFFFTVTANIPNGGISNFLNILLEGDFGYSTEDSLLMSLPTGAVEFVGCPLFGVLAYMAASRKVFFWKYRLSWAIFGAVLSLLASCLLAYSGNNKNAKLTGAFLWYISPISFICVLSNISANTQGYTKKWAVSSINLVAFAAANVAGPQCFIDKQAPTYQGAKTSLVVCYCLMIGILTVIFCLNAIENRRRDKNQTNELSNMLCYDGIIDLTDFENPNFRYTL
ncbi:allantoate permease [Monosporozyma unispora]|nr:hypothetical protein C6P44_002111 [Kazachstania unispora]